MIVNKDNPSVEELLKSLKDTIQSREKPNDNNVVELGQPINRGDGYSDSSIVKFVENVVEQAIYRKILEDSDLLKNAVDNVFSSSSEIRGLIKDSCIEYFDSSDKFEELLKRAIEQKLAQLMSA